MPKLQWSSWWICIPIFILFTINSELFLDPTQPIKFVCLSLLCFFGNIALILHSKKLDQAIFKTSIVKVYTLYILTVAVSLFYTTSPISGIYEVLKLVLYLNVLILGIFYLQLNKHFRLIHLSYLFSIFQFATLTGLLISVFSDSVKINIWQLKPYGGLFANPNISSQLLFLSLPLVIYFILHPERKLVRNIQFTIALLSLIMIVLIGSKTVQIALLVFAFFATLSWLSTRQLIKKGMILGTITLGLALSSLTIYKAYPHISEIHSIKHRKDLWAKTMGIIKDKPIFGGGIASWRVNNLNFVPHEEIQKNRLERNDFYTGLGNIFYERPHNDFLWIWSETGILSLLFYLLLFYLIFRLGLTLFNNSKGREKYLYALLISGLIGYLFIALLSYPKERIEQSFFLMLYFVILVNAYFNLFPSKLRTSRFSPFLIATLSIVSLFCIYWSTARLQSDFHMRNAIEAKVNGNWRLVLSETILTDKQSYAMASNGTPVNWYKGIAQMNMNRIKPAHESFKSAYRLHPTHLYVINNLATSYALIENTDSAIYLYKKALRINPYYEDALINLSGIYYNIGEQEQAWEHISRVPITSLHWKFKEFANAILEEKYDAVLYQIASQNDLLKEAELFIQSGDYTYFQLYSRSLTYDREIPILFLEELKNFKLDSGS